LIVQLSALRDRLSAKKDTQDTVEGANPDLSVSFVCFVLLIAHCPPLRVAEGD